VWTQLAVTYLPAPSVVLYAQLAISAAAAVGLHKSGMVETDPLDWVKVLSSHRHPKHPGGAVFTRGAVCTTLNVFFASA
jgi:hypothetical protein